MASCWQVGRNSKKAKKKLKVFQCCLVSRPSNFEAKLTNKRPQADQKSSKKLISILIQFLMDLGTNLGRFWEDFGGQVGAKLEPNATKTRSQNQSKKLSLFGSPLERFLVDFGSQEPFSILPGFSNFPVFFALGSILAPRRPQDAPRRPKRRPRQPPRPIVHQFWYIFG